MQADRMARRVMSAAAVAAALMTHPAAAVPVKETDARKAVRTAATPLADGMDGHLTVGRCRVGRRTTVCPNVKITAPRGGCRIEAAVKDRPDYYVVRFTRVRCS